MFRDEAQTHAAIRTLLDTLPGLGRLWTDTGPTDEAVRLVETRGGALSSGEALLVFVAFDLWNGQGGAQLGRVFHILSAEPLAALGLLLAAVTRGPDAIDAWIAAQRAPSRGSS